MDYYIFYILIFLYLLAFFVDLWAAFSHPALLGKWKKYHYREKLEWDSFKETLKSKELDNMLLENDSLWEDWLIYGTALGVGEKVREAMKKAGIEDDMLNFSEVTSTTMGFVFVSGTGSGGGFSGGGGFGGGGAGAR